MGFLLTITDNLGSENIADWFSPNANKYIEDAVRNALCKQTVYMGKYTQDLNVLYVAFKPTSQL